MIHDVIVIGSGVAGLTAAIYAVRANLDTVIVDGLQPGGQLTITTDVENYPGFSDPIAGPELMERMRGQAQRLGVKFMVGEAVSADLSRRPFRLAIGDIKDDIGARVLIVATGASARWLGIPSERQLYNKGVSACATCDGFFYRGKDVVVVGGGDTAMEEALYLAHITKTVTVVHRRDELRASKVMQDGAKAHPSIGFAWNSVVDEILDVDKGEVTGVQIKDVVTGERMVIPCQGVFVAIGHTPNTAFLKGQIAVDDNGYIVTKKSTMETSVEGVFAAGDVQDALYRQAITAAGSGCMAAIDAERFLQRAV